MPAMSDHDQRGGTTGSPPGASSRFLAALADVPATAWVVLACALAITAVAYALSRSQLEQRTKDHFLAHSRDVRNAIGKRMLDYELVLRGAAGLFSASDDVNRAEWREYVETLRADTHVPGMQGVGFAVVVRPEDREVHIAEVRAQGFPNYTIWPAGTRASYTAIIFIEPFAGRNDRALGYDMATDDARREAMERARDTGVAAATGRVFLLQDKDRVGIQFYVPVYRKGMPHDTIEQRRAAQFGYVFSPFLMTDLILGTFSALPTDVHFRIYDAVAGQGPHLLYDSRQPGTSPAPDIDSAFRSAHSDTVAFGGRAWAIDFEPRGRSLSSVEEAQPVLIASSGLIIDLLLFATLASRASHRKRAEALARSMTEELRVAASQTQAIVNSVLDGIVSVDGEGSVLTFNPAAEHMFGYAAQEVVGMSFAKLLAEPPEGSAPLMGPLAFAGRGSAQAGRRCEAVGMHKRGTPFPVELSGNRITTIGRTVYVVTFRDISDAKRIERMQDAFVSVVSHELRTPLTSLIGALELINSGVLDAFPNKAAAMLAMATTNAERLSRLVGDIIDVERLRLGRMALQIESIDLVEVCSQGLVEGQPDGDRSGIQLRLEAPGSARVLGDKCRMAQVMTNLLSNALKFSSPGEAVVVAVTRKAGHVRVSVTDRGPGIAQHLQERIFERFFQADRSDQRSNTGAGLGLSIAKAIVEQHGGHIGVESAPGAGATFFFELNEVGEEALPAPPHDQPAVADEGGKISSAAA